MQTETLNIHPQQPASDLIARAASVVRRGGLVAFPTETVYGLGANAFDAQAVAGIFEAKGRPASDPLIVHISSLPQLETVAAQIPPLAHELARHFWPGALTLILKRGERIAANVAANRDTVAVRMPNHPVALALIEAANVPIAAPSANTFSRPSPTTAAHVLEDLAGRIDIILDAGSTNIGLESTILDLTAPVPTVRRPGGIPVEALRVLIPDVLVQPRYLQEEDEDISAPGMLLRHYSPRAEVKLFSGETPKVRQHILDTLQHLQAGGQRVGLLLPDSDKPIFEGHPAEAFWLGGDMSEIAGRLFAGLRDLDRRGVAVILAR